MENSVKYIIKNINQTFEGQIFNNEDKGVGKITYANGDMYNGNVKLSVAKDGEGSMYYKKLNKVYDSEWKDDKSIKNIDIKSIGIKNQQLHGTCWAHSISRNFVRTFQIMDIIKSQYAEQFYTLFFTILTTKKSCNSGGSYLMMHYLLEYLRNNYNEIFTISKSDMICGYDTCEISKDETPILMMTSEDKESLIADLKYLFDNNLLYIFISRYKIDKTKHNPITKSIKLMLDYKLQPYCGINISKCLRKNIIHRKNFTTDSCADDEYACSKNQGGHAVNLRKWMSDGIEFKNSWGTHVSNEGNFNVPDLKYATCDDIDEIRFASVVFDYNKLDKKFKQNINENRCKYFDVVDKNIEVINDIDDVLYEDGFFYTGKKEHKYSNGNVYNGEWAGNPNGFGKMIYTDNKYLHKEYEGTFLSGEKYGRGIMKYVDGKIYDGEWDKDSPNGQCNIKYYDDNKYDGEYIGEIKDGKNFGYGIRKYADGDIYEGMWDKTRQGKGIMKYADGDIYDGEWDKGNIHGQGTMKYSDGDIYEGNWINGEKSGNGTFKFQNGDVYQGEFRNNDINGIGTMTYKTGIKITGNFVDGVLEKSDILKFPNGDIYQGEVLNELPNGKGLMKYANGGEYYGDWVSGKRSGRGILYLKSGNVYSGKLLNDVPNGIGLMTYTDGTEYYGMWENGKKKGDCVHVESNGQINIGSTIDGKITNKIPIDKCVNFGTNIQNMTNKYLKYKTKYFKSKN